jgi:hypothetical protein
MKLKLPKSLTNKQIAAIAVVGVTLPYLLFFTLAASVQIFREPPVKFDFTILQDKIERIDLVDYDYSDDYAVLETLDPLNTSSLLNDLSDLSFKSYGFGDPPSFGGKCVLFTLNDDSYRIVCHAGYAQFTKYDSELDFKVGGWKSIESDEYKTFLERYFTSKLDY